MSRLIPALVLAVSLVSCAEPSLPSDPTLHFDRHVKIVPSRVVDSEKLGLLYPAYLFLFNGWIVTQDFATARSQVCFVSRDYSCVHRAIDVGRGPDEMSEAGRLGVDDDGVYLYDNNFGRMFSLDVCDSSLAIVSRDDFHNYGGTPVTFDHGHVLQSPFTDSLMMRLSDNEGTIISGIPYPHDDVLDGYDFLSLNSLYCNSVIALSPDRSHFAVAPSETGMYIFGSINGLNLNVSRTLNYYSVTLTKNRYGDNFLVPNQHSRINAVYAMATNSHVAFLFSGNPNSRVDLVGRDILVYKWDGTPVVHLISDSDLKSICYDPSSHRIIAIGYTPDPSFLEFSLPDGISL